MPNASTFDRLPPTARVAMTVLLSVGLTRLSIADEAEPALPVGDEKVAAVSYWSEIRPIFQAHCQGCHQPAKSSGDFVMTDFEALVSGGESGAAAIVPRDADGSYLIEQITPIEGQAPMPPDKPPLSDAQVALVRRWIEQGAKNDTPASAQQRYDADHPPKYAAKPVVTSARFSPDGKLLAIGGYHEVLLHDVALVTSGEPSQVGRLIGMSERIEAVAFSPDGKRLAVAGGSPGRLGEAQVWDLTTRELVTSISVSYDTCYGVSWSPDGKLIAVGCPDNTVRAFEVESGEQVLFNGAHNDWVLDTVFSVDSAHLVTVSRDRSMKLIEVATERFVDNITSITPGALKGGLHAVDRHPTKNELLIGGADGIPKTYRMFREKARKIGDDFNLLKKYPEIPGRIFDVEYRHDGQQIVAGSSIDGVGHVQVYNTESAEIVTSLESISSAVYSVGFSPDGKWIVSGGFEGDVSLHDAATGKQRYKWTPVPLTGNAVAEVTR